MYFFSPLAGRPGRLRVALAALALALTLAGCVSVPPPDDLMTLAQNQLQAARDAGAADYAPVDLGFAQDKFQQAQVALAERDYAAAADLAQESMADAELARAKARLGEARAQIKDKLQENTRLREEGEQLAAEQMRMSQLMVPAASAPTAASPVRDMPAPAASVLSAPADGAVHPVSGDNPQPASSTSIQGGQP